MQVGCFGKVIYAVSDQTVRTIRNLQWTNSARLGAHSIHMGETRLEFTGVDKASISYEMQLLKVLGVEPMEELSKLLTYLRTGYQDYWIMGDHRYGTGKWCISKIAVTAESYDPLGRLTAVTAKVTMEATGYG